MDSQCATTVEPTRHEEYYIDDGNVIFQVETTLFKIHRFFFIRHSEIFQSMFTLPPGEGNTAEGQCDEVPIYLPGTTAQEFEHFLWIFYSPDFGEYSAPADKWCSILKLATQWEFASIRSLAIRKLNELPDEAIQPADRIVIAHRFQLDGWLLKPYVNLICRPSPLTIEEGRKLGLEDVILLSRAREEIKHRELQTDRNQEIYYGVMSKEPLIERQSVWNAAAALLDLPEVPIVRRKPQ
ncbi:hypothetical protein FRB94_010193 [Tulasnella sp. JGI-2019a]|nr:hypothetical protein FRB94_010193 [Tulasnella sp. JGI-2019a]KAG9002070.1 hypothetical protein FRB93_011841 [Tulasnella sp. JGI-2019a]